MDALRDDPVMAELIDEHGALEVAPAEDPFHRAVVAIINQQLSTQSAAAIRARVEHRVEITPAALLDADTDALRDAGLSRQKIRYVRNMARYFQDTDVPAALASLGDEAVIAELTGIDGIGPWTAKMVLIFVLGREDVFPVEDLGIRHAMEQLYGITDRAAMTERAEDWAPYRSYAARYLWHAVDG